MSGSFVKDAPNEHGVLESTFLCGECDTEYNVCPAIAPEKREGEIADGCLHPECPSYRVDRDVEAIVGFRWGRLGHTNGSQA